MNILGINGYVAIEKQDATLNIGILRQPYQDFELGQLVMFLDSVFDITIDHKTYVIVRAEDIIAVIKE